MNIGIAYVKECAFVCLSLFVCFCVSKLDRNICLTLCNARSDALVDLHNSFLIKMTFLYQLLHV